MCLFVVLRDPCGTFYPHVGCIVRNAHHRSCFFAVQYQIRLVEQPTDVGARVMARHRMVSVAEGGSL